MAARIRCGSGRSEQHSVVKMIYIHMRMRSSSGEVNYDECPSRKALLYDLLIPGSALNSSTGNAMPHRFFPQISWSHGPIRWDSNSAWVVSRSESGDNASILGFLGEGCVLSGYSSKLGGECESFWSSEALNDPPSFCCSSMIICKYLPWASILSCNCLWTWKDELQWISSNWKETSQGKFRLILKLKELTNYKK